jgi:hypothetical protein
MLTATKVVIYFSFTYQITAAVLQATYEDHAMSKYLMELMLVRHEMCHMNPSLQAAAALCLSLWYVVHFCTEFNIHLFLIPLLVVHGQHGSHPHILC